MNGINHGMEGFSAKCENTSSLLDRVWRLEKKVTALEKDVSVLGDVVFAQEGECVGSSDEDTDPHEE